MAVAVARVAQVVVVTDIDQTTLATIPDPNELGNPFGQAPRPETLTALQQQFPDKPLNYYMFT